VANATWSDAIQCPKCRLTGEHMPKESKQVSTRDGDGNRIHGVTPGAKLHKIYCRNPRCKWFNTNWTVQVNPDGSIPEPDTHRRPRQYAAPDAALAAQINGRLEALQEATMNGGEIRR
jgi:hypothetical protein